MCSALADVRFTPESGHSAGAERFLLERSGKQNQEDYASFNAVVARCDRQGGKARLGDIRNRFGDRVADIANAWGHIDALSEPAILRLVGQFRRRGHSRAFAAIRQRLFRIFSVQTKLWPTELN